VFQNLSKGITWENCNLSSSQNGVNQVFAVSR
jgi:hypothetical protein